MIHLIPTEAKRFRTSDGFKIPVISEVCAMWWQFLMKPPSSIRSLPGR